MCQVRWITLVAVVLLYGCAAGGPNAASVGAMLIVLQQVSGALEGHESTINTAAGDKAHQVKTEIDGLIDRGEKLGKDFNNATSAQREAFVEQSTALLQEAARLTSSVGADVSGTVNSVLVVQTAALQSIPFMKSMRPFVLGTEPLSVTEINKPTPVRAYVCARKRSRGGSSCGD